MNIFFREFRANFKSLMIWIFIQVLFCVVGFSKFTAYYKNPDMLVVLKALPQALLDAFNMKSFNLTTLVGFYGIMISYYALILAIAAAMWGSGIISKEERDKTVEFSLTLPVTRARLVTSKIAVVFVNCIILLLVTWGITVFNAKNYEPDAVFYTYLKISMLAYFMIQMIFMALGVFLGCAMKQHKRSGSMAVSILLGTYVLSVIAGLDKKVDFLKYFSPFKYFDPLLLLKESRIETIYIVLSVAIVAVAIVAAYMTYAKRDLYI